MARETRNFPKHRLCSPRARIIDKLAPACGGGSRAPRTPGRARRVIPRGSGVSAGKRWFPLDDHRAVVPFGPSPNSLLPRAYTPSIERERAKWPISCVSRSKTHSPRSRFGPLSYSGRKNNMLLIPSLQARVHGAIPLQVESWAPAPETYFDRQMKAKWIGIGLRDGGTRGRRLCRLDNPGQILATRR
jgi:hypothetical protein